MMKRMRKLISAITFVIGLSATSISYGMGGSPGGHTSPVINETIADDITVEATVDNPLTVTGTLTVSDTATLIVSSGVDNTANDLVNDGIVDVTGGSLSVTNTITNNDTLNISTGAVVSAGTSYTQNSGLTTVNGTLTAPTVSIEGGLLQGSGTIEGNLSVSNGGIVGPGNSPGSLLITGDYTQLVDGFFDAEIGGLIQGIEYDWMDVTGTANLDGTLNVILFDWGSGSFQPSLGDSFDIITAEILSGTFSTLSYDSIIDPALMWEIEYLTDAYSTTDVVRLSVVSAVPVPAAVWLFGSGLIGLIAVGKRKRVV